MRRCILIVEPNDRGRESLQVLLEARGHEVHVAGTGAQALAKALIFHPDIVVVADYDLRDMPFQQAVFELKAIRSSPVVVAYTGFHLRERETRAAGCDAFVLKPAVERLLAVLEALPCGAEARGRRR